MRTLNRILVPVLSEEKYVLSSVVIEITCTSLRQNINFLTEIGIKMCLLNFNLYSVKVFFQ